jgi:hypothetical protein
MTLRRAPRALVVLVVALVAAGCSGHGHDSGPSPSALGPLPDVPAARSTPGLPHGAIKALASELELKRRMVHVVTSLTSGDHAVALAHFPSKGAQTRRLVSFAYDKPKKRWTVETVSSDLWPDVPAAGSRSYPVTSVAAGPWVGVGGFVDPNVTRLEAAGPTGALVDRQPVKDGAALVFASPGATLAGYDSKGLTFATPVITGPARVVGGGDAAVGIGSAFTAEMLSTRWEAAADLVADGVSPAYLLPPLRGFLSSSRARVAGPGRTTDTGASFIIDSGPLKWRLTLITEPHAGTVKVRQYTLDRLQP